MNLSTAVQDFLRAHRKASLKEITAKITGEQTDLLSYNEVLKQLRTQGQSDRGLQEIPIDAIIGSVGRYTDFTRDFLPRRYSDKDRWSRVKMAMESLMGTPPIEVYKIGEAYFVKDGNHRVSVLRQIGSKYIQAYVTEIVTKVPLNIDDDPSDLIIKSEYADFLEKTGFNEIYPEINLRVSLPGRYEKLLEHIKVHQYFMGIERDHEVPFEEAIRHWYETIYLPMVKSINGQGILRDFPGRTETDLYIWIMRYRAELKNELGWWVENTDAVSNYSNRFSKTARYSIQRVGQSILKLFTPDELETGPSPGTWRKKQAVINNKRENLFENILVAIRNSESGWNTFDQAVYIAQKENSEIFGLHILPDDIPWDSKEALQVKEKFKDICMQANIVGDFAFDQGKIAQRIIERSIWADLIVINLEHPPEPQAIAKLRSGLHTLIHQIGLPLLAVPGKNIEINHALLAYDGSPKANEALYIAAHLAEKWNIKLTVVYVTGKEAEGENTLKYAKKYLCSHNLSANYRIGEGSASEYILKTANDVQCDLIIMGSYGYNPVLEIMLGSTVDAVLMQDQIPVLICR